MLKRNTPTRIFSFVFALLLVTNSLCLAQGQKPARLRIKVTDTTGALVTDARVTTKQGETSQTAEVDGQGEARISRLAQGATQVQVEAPGFATRTLDDVSLRAGDNELEVRLEVVGVEEEVTVGQSETERATDERGDAFSNVLTPEQIAALPDDPEEMERVLKEMAGPDARILVDGFSGGRLPPKSQISRIRFRLNPYAAEYHDFGFGGVDITTKPGIDTWHGSFAFGFRDESLNARNAFAPARVAEQHRRFGFTLDIPVAKSRTALFLAADSTPAYDSQTILAALPEGLYADSIRRPSRAFNLSARLNHQLTETHTTRFEFQRNALVRDNLGVGNFDLPERAYSTNQVEHLLRASDSGPINARFFNEFRLQARWFDLDTDSASDAQTVNVINSFTRGGAQLDARRRTWEIEAADNIDFGYKNHQMRLGILFEAGRYSSDETRNANGTYTFGSLDDLRLARPTIFTRRIGDPAVAFSQQRLGAYIQDDLRLRKNLTVNLGLRYEMQSNIADRMNFAPRLGASWSPFADGRATFRASAGLFYNWFADSLYEQTLRVDGIRQRDLIVRAPAFPVIGLDDESRFLPPSRIQLGSHAGMPRVGQSRLSAELQLPGSFRLTPTYQYNRGVHLWRARNINAPLPGVGRPDPLSGNVTQIESSGNSTAHSLILSLSRSKPLFKRFTWNATYILSSARGDFDGPLSLPADNFDLQSERGPSPFDARHRFNAFVSGELYKGFRLGSYINYISALPYNVTTGFDDNGDTIINDRPHGVTRNSERGAALLNMDVRLSRVFGFGEPRAASAATGPQVITVGRNSGDTLGALSGLNQTNKRWNIEFYAQASNVLNHTNLVGFSGVQSSPFFGNATAALPGRRIETGMKFSF